MDDDQVGRAEPSRLDASFGSEEQAADAGAAAVADGVQERRSAPHG